MTNAYEMFGTNDDLESGKGVTIDYGPFEITINRAGGNNAKFSKILNQKFRPHRHQQERGTLDDNIAKRILLETYAEAVVLGWKKVKDEKGKNLPFTTENCIKLFNNLPDLFADIQKQANDFLLFKTNNEEIEEKN